MKFLRVATCSPEVWLGDLTRNADEIIRMSRLCAEDEAEVALFPELSLTGYTCADLFDQELLLDKVKRELVRIAEETAAFDMAIVVGAPLQVKDSLYNCGVLLHGGRIAGVVPKTNLPNYDEFYEKRWFHSGKRAEEALIAFGEGAHVHQDVPFGRNLLFEIHGVKLGIEICEDLWVPTPRSSVLAVSGAEVILNPSATNELVGKHKYLVDLIKNQSARCRCGYAYASAGLGESSTDLAFAGNCIVAENGVLLTESPRFEMGEKMSIADIDIDILRYDRRHYNTFRQAENREEMRVIVLDKGKPSHKAEPFKFRKIDAHPFVDSDPNAMAARCEEISSIQAWGLAVRLRAIGCRNAVVGISGGLDSTLALLVTVRAFDMLGLDRNGIIGITMPGFGTTDRTRDNAYELMRLLGVTQREISIAKSVELHFEEIGHDPAVHDVTYENSQARERTQILMDVANQVNGIVVGTGDLSELALGWCTYCGDQMSMYSVNGSIPKTLVRHLVEFYALSTGNAELRRVLEDIVNTPISPELLPPDANDDIAQKTEDLVGPYELHDFFLWHVLRYGAPPRKILALAQKGFEGKYDDHVILHWLKTFYRRFFSQQFKRSCMPDGVKAGSVSLSPRGDWRMPSDATARLWLDELADAEKELSQPERNK